ncbi:MAG: glycerol-3-phosphate acyltransferase [bacterium]
MAPWLVAVILTPAGYLLGSVLFAVLLARLRRRDVRSVGDRNPGAVNAFKAAGPVVGTAALLLDFLKGALPVGLARWSLGVDGWWLIPVALAPVLGHAFPLFARFRGGKAVAVTFGAWCGLTLWEGPTVLSVLLGLAWLAQAVDSWNVVFAQLALGGWWLARGADPALLAVWAGSAAVLAFKHRRELRRPPRLRRRRRC